MGNEPQPVSAGATGIAMPGWRIAVVDDPDVVTASRPLLQNHSRGCGHFVHPSRRLVPSQALRPGDVGHHRHRCLTRVPSPIRACPESPPTQP